MHNDVLYPILMIAVAALVTWLTRAIPFLVFGKRQLPGMVVYLGEVLPPAIMVILVKNMYVSIILGTVCYMLLLRVL